MKNDWAQVVVKFITELKCIVLGVFGDLFSPALLPLGVTVPYNMMAPPISHSNVASYWPAVTSLCSHP